MNSVLVGLLSVFVPRLFPLASLFCGFTDVVLCLVLDSEIYAILAGALNGIADALLTPPLAFCLTITLNASSPVLWGKSFKVLIWCWVTASLGIKRSVVRAVVRACTMVSAAVNVRVVSIYLSDIPLLLASLFITTLNMKNWKVSSQVPQGLPLVLSDDISRTRDKCVWLKPAILVSAVVNVRVVDTCVLIIQNPALVILLCYSCTYCRPWQVPQSPAS